MSESSTFDADVKQYWEQESTVSIIDKNLHELEMQRVLRHLSSGDRLADVGSGDGVATLRYADAVREVVGFERSDRLRGIATEHLKKSGKRNVRFEKADILSMGDVGGPFDAVVTQRLLINMSSWEDQQKGIVAVHRMLKPGGRYIMVENTDDAMQAMNALRHKMGLDPVPQHWHNRFFDYDALMGFMDGKFQKLKEYNFGFYYVLTRIFLPSFAKFEGYGSRAVKDPIYERADREARRLYEFLEDVVDIKGCRAFGPIQVFVFRREGPELG